MRLKITKTNHLNIGISSGKYDHLRKISVVYEGIVEPESGLLLYVYCEKAVAGFGVS